MEARLISIIIFSIVLLEKNRLTTGECQEPDPVSQAYRDLERDKVIYECIDSFLLSGSRDRNCDAGSWDGDPAECIIDCGVPGEGFGAVVKYNDTLEGSIAKYTCKANFTTRDSDNEARICSRNGRWSGSPLKCTGTEDLARGKAGSMTDGNRQTCKSFIRTGLISTSLQRVTLSSDSNVLYNVHEVELDLAISSSNYVADLTVSVEGVVCQRLGIYSSGVYRFTCKSDQAGSRVTIRQSYHIGSPQVNVCEIQVYGSRNTGECERPPIVVGARVNFTSTYWNAKAVYRCVDPYRYAGGYNVITCGLTGWTTPAIVCKEMENLARIAESSSAAVDDNKSTCVEDQNITLSLKSRLEVQWIVVYTKSNNSPDLSVKLMTTSNDQNQKTCVRDDPPASIDGYDMIAFKCQGYPFADFVKVTGESSKPICEIEVYGRKASQALQCMQQPIGRDYKGDMNLTISGKPCIDWPSQQLNIDNFPDYSFQEIGSKCRAPRTTGIGPFCYISPSVTDFCPVPLCDKVCLQGDGRTYSGSINKASDISCSPWDSVAPNEFDFSGISAGGAFSYCRNPFGSMSSPWCYNSTKTASLCSVPTCPTSVAVATSLPVDSSLHARATCFCWYHYNNGFLDTHHDKSVGDILDRCTRWGLAIMMCYTKDEYWTLYSIGTYVSSSSVTETPSTPAMTLPSSTPAVTLTKSTPAVALTKSTPAVTLTSSTPAVTLTKSTPAVTLTSSTPAVTLTNNTPAVTLTSSTPAVTLTNSTPMATLTNSTPAVSLASSSLEATLTPELQSYGSVTSVNSSVVQSPSTDYSTVYNLSASPASLSSTDQASTYNLSTSTSVAEADLNISSTFEPSTPSSYSLSSVVAMSSSTSTVTVGTTEVPTTTSTPVTTTTLKQNCQCRCKRNLSPAAISEVIDEMKANLTVNPRETAAFLRKKTSAKDERPTATVSGTTCVAVVSVLFSAIFIPDIINVVSYFISFFKK